MMKESNKSDIPESWIWLVENQSYHDKIVFFFNISMLCIKTTQKLS